MPEDAATVRDELAICVVIDLRGLCFSSGPLVDRSVRREPLDFFGGLRSSDAGLPASDEPEVVVPWLFRAPPADDWGPTTAPDRGPRFLAATPSRVRGARCQCPDAMLTSEISRARLNEIDAEMRNAVPLGTKDVARAQELVANLDLLWDKLTPRERARAVGALIEDVYVSVRDSLVGAIVPKPRFRALLEAAVGTSPGGKVGLIPPGGLAVVEMRGFEPLTFALRTRHSTN